MPTSPCTHAGLEMAVARAAAYPARATKVGTMSLHTTHRTGGAARALTPVLATASSERPGPPAHRGPEDPEVDSMDRSADARVGVGDGRFQQVGDRLGDA